MIYLLMPLEQHADLGFGAHAMSYMQAAKFLEESGFPARCSVNSHLPINFLRRHAVELFLKSGIIIFHRTLQLSYENEPWYSKNRKVQMVDGTWTSMSSVHSVEKLYRYHGQLFEAHNDWLEQNTPVKWGFNPSMDEWIKTIEEFDPDGTHSRYPETRRPQNDVRKASMVEQPIDNIVQDMNVGGKAVMALLMLNDNEEVVQSFGMNREADSVLTAALEKATEQLSACHAAMRHTLTGGL